VIVSAFAFIASTFTLAPAINQAGAEFATTSDGVAAMIASVFMVGSVSEW
jgi:hypothetical protein